MKTALGLLVMFAACFLPGPVAAENVADTPTAVADLRPMEVRLRKLHLVRPDLQRFPIPYDVVC